MVEIIITIERVIGIINQFKSKAIIKYSLSLIKVKSIFKEYQLKKDRKRLNQYDDVS